MAIKIEENLTKNATKFEVAFIDDLPTTKNGRNEIIDFPELGQILSERGYFDKRGVYVFGLTVGGGNLRRCMWG